MNTTNRILFASIILLAAILTFSACSKKDKDKKSAEPAVEEKAVEKSVPPTKEETSPVKTQTAEKAVKQEVPKEPLKTAVEPLQNNKTAASAKQSKIPQEASSEKTNYDNLKTSSEKIDFLNSFDDIYSSEGKSLLNKALNDPDPSVRLVAIELLGGCLDQQCNDQTLIPIFEKALTDESAEVAAAALEAVEDYNFPSQKSNLITPLINHPNPDIQEQALMASQDLPKEDAIHALETAIYSQNKEIRELAIDLFASQPSPRSADILLQNLARTSDADTQDQIISTLTMYFGEPFEDYQQAIKWWNNNRSRFDDELNEIAPEQ